MQGLLSQSLWNCDRNLGLHIPNALRSWANSVLLGFLHEKPMQKHLERGDRE